MFIVTTWAGIATDEGVENPSRNLAPVERIPQGEVAASLERHGEHPCTTTTDFITRLPDEIAQAFSSVPCSCQREGLIGREMFAIDGLKLSSNASKHESGTRKEFRQRAAKLERTTRAMLQRHRAADAKQAVDDVGQERKTVERLRTEASIDSDDDRRCYDRRFATAEPVFANIRHNKWMNRFTLRGLGVAAEKRSHHLPEVPTFEESGLADFKVQNWYGIPAPAGTPQAIVQLWWTKSG